MPARRLALACANYSPSEEIPHSLLKTLILLEELYLLSQEECFFLSFILSSLGPYFPLSRRRDPGPHPSEPLVL